MISRPILIIDMNAFQLRNLGLVVLVAVVLVFGATSSAWAMTATSSAENQQIRMTNLKTRASAEIDRRVASLSGIITKINANKRLTAAQKQGFVSGINAEIASLTSLKSKIANDTDVATLKSDVQSIVTSYRVYLLYIPQIHILAADDVIGTSSDRLASWAVDLSNRIQQARQAGKDVASLQASYNDLLSKVAAAKTAANTADVLVIPLQPSGYPGNKSQLVSARADVTAGLQDLKAALQDAKSIVQGLKAFEKSTGATGSATPVGR